MFFGGFPGMGGMGGMGGGPSGPVDNEKLYETLGVSKDASEADIKKAYRKLAVKHHPDKGGDAELFQEISKAYEILSNPEKRQAYDQYGEDGLEGGGGPGGDPSEVFNMFFGGGGGGGGGRQRGPRRTEDIAISIKCTLEQLYSGCSRKLSLSREVLCSGCKGEGGRDGAKKTDCSTCRGQGVVITMTRMGNMISQSQGPCKACKGEGKSIPADKTCLSCKGACTVKEKKIIECEVPPGSRNGSKIVFEKQSDERPGFETGSVVVKVEEEPHGTFKRIGEHLLIENYKITLLEALTGFSIQIKHLDGRKLVLKSPAGVVVKPGDQLKVDREGMPVEGNRARRGALVIKFDVVFPEKIDEAGKSSLAAVLPNKTKTARVQRDNAGTEIVGEAPTDPKKEADYEFHYLEIVDASFLNQKGKAKEAYHGDDGDEDEEMGGGRRGGPGGVECRQS